MERTRDEDDPTVSIRTFEGVVNTVSPERLTIGQLESAVNIDLDDAKQPRRRRGYALRVSGNFHSLFTSESGVTLAVRDGGLVRVFPDYTTQALGYDCGPDPVSYLELADTIYFASRSASGRLHQDMSVEPWGQQGGDGTWLSPVVNPTATLGEVGGKLLRKPPRAEWLAYLNGRIFLATDSVMWATELYLYDLVDATRTFFQYEARITGIMTCGEGMYVGTERAVYYVSGPLSNMQRRTVTETGCIAGSMIRATGDMLQAAGEPAQAFRDAVVFMSPQGLIYGFPNGVCRNVTDSRMVFPHGRRVAPVLRQQDGMHHYVAVIDSGGGPQSSARIGSYVHAEIRRAAHTTS